MHRYLALLAFVATGLHAQTPPAIEGSVYVATYVEVLPAASNDGAALLKQYRDAARKEAGNQRMELVQETGRPTRFILLAVWVDQKAYKAASLDSLKSHLAAPPDERTHSGMAVAGRDALRAGPVVVATHVDVPGNLKDAVLPILRDIAEASRKDAGNLRYEVLQQGNRPNHFTVVEAWTDQKAYEAHVAAAHTRQFRGKLGPMVGALYDERLYRPVD